MLPSVFMFNESAHRRICEVVFVHSSRSEDFEGSTRGRVIYNVLKSSFNNREAIEISQIVEVEFFEIVSVFEVVEPDQKM